MEPLRKGTNGWTCMAANPNGPDPGNGWSSAHEAMPLCGDVQAFKWITAYMKGNTPKMDSDGWAWMLHGDMGEDNAEPGHVGNLTWKKAHKSDWIESGAHLMLMPKDPVPWSKEGMNMDFNTGGPYTMFAGTKYAHVMIPAKHYYHYQAPHQPTITKLLDATNTLINKSAPPASLVVPLFCIVSVLLGVMLVARFCRTSHAAFDSTFDPEAKSVLENPECIE
jgi:hypothetical protein